MTALMMSSAAVPQPAAFLQFLMLHEESTSGVAMITTLNSSQ